MSPQNLSHALAFTLRVIVLYTGCQGMLVACAAAPCTPCRAAGGPCGCSIGGRAAGWHTLVGTWTLQTAPWHPCPTLCRSLTGCDMACLSATANHDASQLADQLPLPLLLRVSACHAQGNSCLPSSHPLPVSSHRSTHSSASTSPSHLPGASPAVLYCASSCFCMYRRCTLKPTMSGSGLGVYLLSLMFCL